ncbi:MAG: hypothetical protein RR904_06440, partial [Bacilli bacterium]
MVLVYIENSQLLSKVIMLLENSKIIFTTDFNDNYDILLVAQFNKRTVKMVRNNYFLKKKIVFLTYLEESKININYNSNNKLSTDYQINLNDFLNLFDLIIVSLPYFKKLLNKNINRNIIVIEKTVSLFDDNVYSRYKLNKRRRKILYLDNKFDYITDFFKIALSNPKMDFIMIGFLPDYYLTKYKKQLLMNKPNNVKCIKYYDDLVLNELIKIVDCIIYTDKVIDMTIVYKSLFYKKN